MPIKLAKKVVSKKTNLSSPVRVYKGLKNSSWGKKQSVRLAVFLLACGGIGYLTFSTFAATTVAHPDGALVQFGNPSIYMIQGGHLRGITSEDALNSNHYNWGMVTVGNASDAALPAGPNIGIRAGTLVMTPGDLTVWVIADSGNGNYSKVGIPSPAIFDALGYSYSQVLTVPAWELPPTAPYLMTGAIHAGGQFVVSGGIVYMIGSSGKWRVADPSVLNTYNFPLYNAVSGDVAATTVGFLPFHEGSLVEGTGGKSVYMIGCANSGGASGECAMQKHGFTDEATLAGLGYNFNEVLLSPQGNLDGITTGANVSLPAPCLPNNPLCNPPVFNPPPPPPPPPATTTPPPSTCLPKNPLCTPANPTPTPKPPAPPPTGVCLPNNPLCTPNSNNKSPSGSIDTPAVNAKVTGMVNIAGWALDNTSKSETKISGITVTVEGHPAVGTLTKSLLRSDVCNRYPGRAGCPYVGWQFSWNSASVPNGTYEIEVKITDSDPGGFQSTTLTRRVTTNNAIPPSGAIYEPAASSRVTGLVTIRGWAMDNTVKAEHAITSVKISVNGQLVGNASYGQQDSTTSTVCSNYPGRPGCPKIGWSFALNTAQYQSGSTLNVKATITDADSPPASTTIGATYVVGRSQTQVCPAGQTGTPPNCKTPPPTGGTGASQTIQVVYAYPSDMAPDQVELKNIPLGISQFQTFLKKSTAGVISSKPNGIAVNLSSGIQRVTLPKTTLQYEQAAGITSNHSVDISLPLDTMITKDLVAQLSTAGGKKYLVYIDGTYRDANCGWGGGAWAKFYLKATQYGNPAKHEASVPCESRGSSSYVGGPMAQSFFQNLAPLHEIFHTLGIMPGCSAHFDKTDYGPGSTASSVGHATEVNDIMHWEQGPLEFVDANHDDYYGPNLPASCPGLTSPEDMEYFNTL